MVVSSWWYKTADTVLEDRLVVQALDRKKHMTSQYLGMASGYIDNIAWAGNKRALVYAGGPALHHSDLRNVKDLAPKEDIVIKSQMGNNVYQVAKRLYGISYVSSNANTCASSVHAILEAKRLLADGYSDVVVYAEEATDDTLLLLFKQLQIDLVCGDGAAMMHFTATGEGAFVKNVEWAWRHESTRMAVSKVGYLTVMPDVDVDFVKVHGSGTATNEIAETAAVEEKYGDVKTVRYKDIIGHTQGASALVELCMLLESDVQGRGLVLASGLGGYYGSIDITI